MSESLDSHMVASVQARIAGTFATVKPMYSVLPDGDNRDTATFTRNSSFWLKNAADWTAICAATAFESDFTPTVIHPRFLICAYHYRAALCGFIGSNDVIYWCEITWYQVGALDIGIGLITRVFHYVAGVLTEDGTALPATVTPVKVAGSTFLTKARNGNQFNTPLINVNSRREVSLLSVQWFNFSGAMFYQEPHNAVQDSFYQAFASHPSSTPLLVNINGELALVGVVQNGVGQTESLIENLSAINAEMASHVAGASLTEVNVSGFPELDMSLTDNTCIAATAWRTNSTWSLNHKPTASENAIVGVGGNYPANPPGAESPGKLTVTNIVDDYDVSNVFPAAWSVDGSNSATVTIGGPSGNGPFTMDDTDGAKILLAQSHTVAATTYSVNGGAATAQTPGDLAITFPAANKVSGTAPNNQFGIAGDLTTGTLVAGGGYISGGASV